MKRKSDNKLDGTSVVVRDQNIEGALKIFKSKVYNSGKIKEVYDRQFFIKPSVVKRKQKLKANYIQKIRTDEENSK